jgi:two-component system, sensor histidine kinase and response regulator
MPHPPTLSLNCTVSSGVFLQVGDLLRQTVSPDALVLTEAVLPIGVSLESLGSTFVLVVSPDFSALWQGTQVASNPDQYETVLAFDPTTIAPVLAHLTQILPPNSVWLAPIAAAQPMLRPNDAVCQSHFTLALINLLTANSAPVETLTLGETAAVCQPIAQALDQQIAQERVLHQVATQIRQSLELPVILDTAVQQVRQFLQSDRLVIYQFNLASTAQLDRPTESIATLDRITYEACRDHTIPSVLNLSEMGHCFRPPAEGYYVKGKAVAIADVEVAYQNQPCLLALLQASQVRAKLLTPIIVQERLWGLLIAHQCEVRHWEESEQAFLQKIAEHLAIAIDQASLYAQLQQQKDTLEQRVIEHTQELRDTLMAAQSASRAKTDFLSTMSHELKTPLTCIIGMSATLLRWSGQQPQQRSLPIHKQKEYLQTIHNSGEHLLELINDILDLSQVEAGKTVLTVSAFSLSQIAQQTLQLLQERATQHAIALTLDSRIPPEQETFRADMRRVRQILINLLNNAIKFTPEQGQVTLRVRVMGDHAVLQVIDTGIGIPAHQRPLLFQKFQQLEPSLHRKYEGTGLGLALTKQLVELHGGWIEVESEVGVGSIFTVHLPNQPLPVNEPQRPTAPTVPLLNPRIFLIAGQEATADAICDLLTAADYQVVWMMESETALKRVEVLQPPIVIVDLQVPGSVAYEVIRQLKLKQTTQEIKILALLGEDAPSAIADCLAVGATDCLVDPLRHPEQLITKIAALVAPETI